MRKTLFIFGLIAIIFACNSSGSSNNSSNPEAAMSGKEAYKMYCVACHGDNGKMGFSGATDLSISTMDIETRKLQIKNGKGLMNPFKGILSDVEIENVAVYIEALRVEQ